MFQYHYLNKISDKGTALWTDEYKKTEEVDKAEAIVVRSAAMHDMTFSKELLTIAREMGSHSADRELYRIYENKKRHMIRSLYSTAMRLYYNKKYDLCRSMLELCMQLGLGDATYAIGCLYEFGITTAPDRRIALRFYKKAYEQGYSDPRQYHKQSMLRISK